MSFNIEREKGKKRVVIVGGGFGGLKLADKLSKSNFQVILIDKTIITSFRHSFTRWHLPALSRVLSRFLSGKYSGKNLM